jgi:hypothetical protein
MTTKVLDSCSAELLSCKQRLDVEISSVERILDLQARAVDDKSYGHAVYVVDAAVVGVLGGRP